MLVLAVDTAGATGDVLLARHDDAGATAILGVGRLEPREFSRQLISSVTELLKANRLELSAVDAFAVVSGPGSFTGLRVGLSAVKAMAEVTARPIIAVSRLAMMAAAADVSSTAEGTVHAVLDAGRGEFYHGIYRDAGRTCVEESLQTLATLAASFKSVPGVIVVSEPAVVDALGGLTNMVMQQIPLVTVHEALPLVLAAWHTQSFTDVVRLDANYLRRIEPVPASKPVSAPQAGSTRSNL